MKYLYITLISFFFIASSYSQNTNEFYNPDNTIEEKKVGVKLDIGTSYLSFGNSGVFNSYISPSLSYKLSPKLSILLGVVFINSNYKNIFNSASENVSLSDASGMQSYLRAQAQYQFSERLKITGEILYGKNNIYSKLGINGANSQNISYSVSAEYKLTDNITIGLQLRKSNRNPYNYYNNALLFGNNYGFGTTGF